MKKQNLIFLLLFAGLVTANAQIEGDGDDGFRQRPSSNTTTTTDDQTKTGKRIVVTTKHYKYEFSLGLRAGAGLSTMAESEDLTIYDGSGLGLGGGLAANIRFGGEDNRGRALDGQGLFGIGLELNYKNHSVKTKAKDDLKLAYFEVPIMLQFYPWYNSKQLKNLYIEAGATVAGSLSASPDDISYKNTTYATGELKGFDVKPTLGAGYRFNKNSANDGFYINARYYLGTSKLAGNFPGKISSAEVSVGYLFKFIGTKK